MTWRTSAIDSVSDSLHEDKNIETLAIFLRASFLSMMLMACEIRTLPDDSLAVTTPTESQVGESVRTAALSADGSFAAFSLIDGSVSVWDIAQRREIRKWPTQQFGGGAEFLDFTDEGKLLLMAGIDHSVAESELRHGDINYIVIWNVIDGTTKRIWTMKGARLTAVSPSGDGSKIVAGFSNGLIVVFDEKSVSRSDYVLHTDKVTDVQLSRDGRYALSGSVDGKAYYWNVSTGAVLQTFTHKNRVTKVAANIEFSVGFTSDALNNQRLWNLHTGDLIVPLKHHQRWIYISEVHFSQEGDFLLIASPSSAVSIWDARDGSSIGLWNSDFPVIDVALNKWGSLVSIGSTGIVETWKIKQ